MIKRYEHQILNLKDHGKVVRMGQETVLAELKVVKVELKEERRKYDRFLVRDRERLGYANDMAENRKMVQESYENEVNRQL